MIALVRALIATTLQCVGLLRLAEKFDPVMCKAQQCQAIKTPNLPPTHPL